MSCCNGTLLACPPVDTNLVPQSPFSPCLYSVEVAVIGSVPLYKPTCPQSCFTGCTLLVFLTDVQQSYTESYAVISCCSKCIVVLQFAASHNPGILGNMSSDSHRGAGWQASQRISSTAAISTGIVQSPAPELLGKKNSSSGIPAWQTVPRDGRIRCEFQSTAACCRSPSMNSINSTANRSVGRYNYGQDAYMPAQYIS